MDLTSIVATIMAEERRRREEEVQRMRDYDHGILPRAERKRTGLLRFRRSR